VLASLEYEYKLEAVFPVVLVELPMNSALKMMPLLALVLVVLGCGKEPKKEYTQKDMVQILKEDPDPNMRYWAARELGKSTGEQVKPAVAALTEALKDPEEVVRAGAAYGLGDLGAAAASAKPALQKASRDPSREVREGAAYALKHIGQKQ
jgi:HEAT repeat protein